MWGPPVVLGLCCWHSHGCCPIFLMGWDLLFGAQHHPAGWDHSEGLDHPCSILTSLPAAGVGTGISFWIRVSVSCSKESLHHADFGAFPAHLALKGGAFPGGWELGGSHCARTGSWRLFAGVESPQALLRAVPVGAHPITVTHGSPALCPPSPRTHFPSLAATRAKLGASLCHIPRPGTSGGAAGGCPPLQHTGMPFVLFGVWGNSAALGFSLLFWKFKTFAGRPTRALPPRREALG